MSTSQEISCFINLRRRKAALLSSIEIQNNLYSHLGHIFNAQCTLKRILTALSQGTYSKDGTLEKKALRALFTKQ